MYAQWFKKAIIYQIFVDRFSRGVEADKNPTDCWNTQSKCGGTLTGVIERLPYLEELGINTIWLTPINKTDSSHGYNIIDHYEVDPDFGSKDILHELINKAHERGIQMIMDFVPNHVYEQNPIFTEARDDRQSPYRKWFYFRDDNSYEAFYQYPSLPKLNLDYGPARDYIVDAAKYWLDFGFDGFRIDHVFGPSHDFWKHFRKELKESHPDAPLIGEAWGFEGVGKLRLHDLHTVNIRGKYLKYLVNAQDSAMKEYYGELDGTLDFRFKVLARRFIAESGDTNRMEKFDKALKKHYAYFPKDFFLPSFLDNHDMNRFLFEAGGDDQKLKDAATVQFAQDQPPVIYYGDEIAMSQEKYIGDPTSGSHNQVRRMYPWWIPRYDEMFYFYKDLIKARKDKQKTPDLESEAIEVSDQTPY